MKYLFIIALAILPMCNLFAQKIITPPIPKVCGIYFDYDAAGNRIKRYYDCKDPAAAPDPPKGGAKQSQEPDNKDDGGNNQSRMVDIESGNVVVFPNPITDKFNIKLSKTGTNTHFHLYDGKGAILSSGSIETDLYEGNMMYLPAGNYIISVYFEGKTYSFQITKI